MKVTMQDGKTLLLFVTKRNGVECLTVRAEYGGLILLPDYTNQIGIVVSK